MPTVALIAKTDSAPFKCTNPKTIFYIPRNVILYAECQGCDKALAYFNAGFIILDTPDSTIDYNFGCASLEKNVNAYYGPTT